MLLLNVVCIQAFATFSLANKLFFCIFFSVEALRLLCAHSCVGGCVHPKLRKAEFCWFMEECLFCEKSRYKLTSDTLFVFFSL